MIKIAVFFGLNFKILNLAFPILEPNKSPNVVDIYHGQSIEDDYNVGAFEKEAISTEIKLSGPAHLKSN